MPDLVLFLGPFSFACRSFIIKGDAQGRFKEGNTDMPRKNGEYMPQKHHFLSGSCILSLLIYDDVL